MDAEGRGRGRWRHRNDAKVARRLLSTYGRQSLHQTNSVTVQFLPLSCRARGPTGSPSRLLCPQGSAAVGPHCRHSLPQADADQGRWARWRADGRRRTGLRGAEVAGPHGSSRVRGCCCHCTQRKEDTTLRVGPQPSQTLTQVMSTWSHTISFREGRWTPVKKGECWLEQDGTSRDRTPPVPHRPGPTSHCLAHALRRPSPPWHGLTKETSLSPGKLKAPEHSAWCPSVFGAPKFT